MEEKEKHPLFENPKVGELYQRLVDEYFRDPIEAWMWFGTPHPTLGTMCPLEMIILGRMDKLEKFVDMFIKGELP